MSSVGSRKHNHQGLNNIIPFPTYAVENGHGKIKTRERLGELLKYQYRQAAELIFVHSLFLPVRSRLDSSCLVMKIEANNYSKSTKLFKKFVCYEKNPLEYLTCEMTKGF